ncbi:MAG: ABC transporter permease, partial [Opitutales bacterium]|nr:ABC transporter permease [Opitutales bacterium]
FQSLRLEKELEIEMQHHLAFSKKHYEREGMSSNAAKKAALKGFGNVESLKEDCRDSWGTRMINDFIRDFRYSTRLLLKNKIFSCTVILTLALCIGANATIFSLLHRIVISPLPFYDSDRIVQVFNVFQGQRQKTSNTSWVQYSQFKDKADHFENFALSQLGYKVVNGEEIDFCRVDAEFFEFFGIQPLLGRFFTEAEQVQGSEHVMVLTYSEWKNHYLSDPNVIGKKVEFLIGPSHTIIGVAPKRIESLYHGVRFFTSLKLNAVALNPSTRHLPNLDLWARLMPEVTREQARLQLESLESSYIETNNPGYFERWKNYPRHFDVGPPHALQFSLIFLQIATLFLLLLGSVNVLNLMFVRSMQRAYELSVRYSFGARRITLARVMLIESAILSSLAAIAALGITFISLAAFNNYLIILFPNTQPVSLTGATYLSIAGVTFVLGILLGLLPLSVMWKSKKIQQYSNTRNASTDKKTKLFTNGLITTQIAITFTLLVGALLLIKSLQNVLHVDPGFDAEQIVRGNINIRSVYKDRNEWINIRKQVLDKMEEIPGVHSTTYESYSMVVSSKSRVTDDFGIRGGSFEDEVTPPIFIKLVGRNYFETMGIRMKEGSGFNPSGDAISSGYVVDENFVDRYLQGRNSLQTQICREGLQGPWGKIVGVAERANFFGLANRDGTPVVYICVENNPTWRFSALLVTSRPLDAITNDMRLKLEEINPRLHLTDIDSLKTSLGDLHTDRNAVTKVTSAFAILALLLSAVGIFGVLAYEVKRKETEIGIRKAIGADRSKILGLILRQGVLKTLTGLLLGLVASFLLTEYLENMLFDIDTLDIERTYIVTGILLLLIATLASVLPAIKATHVNPMVSLSSE